MKKKMRLLPMVLLLGILMLAGCQSTTEEQGPIDEVAVSIVETDVTLTAEDFVENKLTVLNIWATWCPPCVRELPELQRISEAYQDKGVALIGVLEDGIVAGEPDDEVIATAQTLLQSAGVTYRIVLPDEALRTAFIDGMQYFPTTFFIDAEGAIVETVVGANDYRSWSKLIDEVLEKLED